MTNPDGECREGYVCSELDCGRYGEVGTECVRSLGPAGGVGDEDILLIISK